MHTEHRKVKLKKQSGYSIEKEDTMKKTALILMVTMLTVLASSALAGDKANDDGKLGRLFLFQKCDPSLAQEPPSEEPLQEGDEAEKTVYDTYGCPLPGNGPWPIFPDNRRWGQMKYNLMGEEFKFSFQGKRLVPDTDYTLIYYPDPWPGEGLICLGSSKSNPNGNIQIHGKMEIPLGLPQPYDANFNPIEPSGATGAKIWLVTTNDVDCDGWDVDVEGDEGTTIETVPAQMIGWNPADYLFEGNLIVYQNFEEAIDDMDVDDSDTGDTVADDTESTETVEESVEDSAPAPGNSDHSNSGKAKGKEH
jgi:hypothetical protein